MISHSNGQNLYFNNKIQKLTEQHRTYKHQSENILQYFSTPPRELQAINGAVKDINKNEIVCRHLSYYFLIMEQHERNSYKCTMINPIMIKSVPFLINAIYDKNNILYQADSYHFIDTVNFGSTIYELMVNSAEPIYCTLLSDVHAVALTIKYSTKNNCYIVKLYDPNRVIHVRVIVQTIEDLKTLSLDHMLGQDLSRQNLIDLYHLNDNCKLLVYSDPKNYHNKNTAPGIRAVESQLTLHLQQKSTLKIRDFLGLIWLNNNSLQFEILSQVKLACNQPINNIFYTNFILKAEQLTEEKKLALLEYKDSKVQSLGEYQLCSQEYEYASHISNIANSNLANEAKQRLLTIRPEFLELNISLDNIKRYCHSIANSNLSEELKQKLLLFNHLNQESKPLVEFQEVAKFELNQVKNRKIGAPNKKRPPKKVDINFDD